MRVDPIILITRRYDIAYSLDSIYFRFYQVEILLTYLVRRRIIELAQIDPVLSYTDKRIARINNIFTGKLNFFDGVGYIIDAISICDRSRDSSTVYGYHVEGGRIC